MDSKKHPKADLYRKVPLFRGIGFLISLTLIGIAFEWKTYKKNEELSLYPLEDDFELLIDMPVTKYNIPQPLPPPVIIPPLPQKDIIQEKDIEADAELIEDLSAGKTDSTLLVTRKAMPVGGMEAFYAYIAENLCYPAEAKNTGIQGRVYIHFIIDAVGMIKGIKVLKGIGGGCDEEAIRLVSEAPPWEPAREKGVPIPESILLPISFDSPS